MALLTEQGGGTSVGNGKNLTRPGEARRGQFFHRESNPEVWEVRAGCIGRATARPRVLMDREARANFFC